MGPTAAGKTDAAIYLYQKYSCDIISVDSALVYKGMDIGTAKPDRQTLSKAPHALIDICETWQPYSASKFQNDANKLMDQSFQNQRIPLLAGGTMLYYKALLNGLSKLPDADITIRKNIEQLAKKEGWKKLHKQLSDIDPQSAARIHPNDPQRISRALEVYEITGKTLSHWFAKKQTTATDFNCLKIIICPQQRTLLHERIEQRFHFMMRNDFLKEVRQLAENPKNHRQLPSMRSVGYRQALQYINNEIDRETMIEKAIIATRQLAKRQLTWLRKETNGHWVDPSKKGYLFKIQELVESFIS